MSKKDNIQFLNNDYAYLGDHGVVVAFGEPISEPAKTPTLKKETGKYADLAPWGTNNLFPQEVVEMVDQDPELNPLLDWKSRALQGREIIAVQNVYDEAEGKYKLKEINDNELKSLLNSTMVERYWREACIDFTWFNQFFPDLIKAKDGDKLGYIGVHEAAWSRWGAMNASGTVEKCYVSARWDENPDLTDKEKVMPFDVVDPYDPLLIDTVKNDKKLSRFIYSINYPTPNKAYYPVAAWTSFLFSDWFKIKRNIPIWKLKLMTQVLSASFILTIPVNYWPVAYKDWHSKTEKEQKEIKKAKVKEINDQITGKEGVGKTVLSEVGVDENGKLIPMITIERIKGALEDGKYTEDSSEVSQFLNRSLGVDSTLVGAGPGKGMTAGSGSDKRVAFNIYCALLEPYRKVILEPLNFYLRYNGYYDKYPTLKLHVVEVDLQTLDQGSTTTTTNPVDNPPTP